MSTIGTGPVGPAAAVTASVKAEVQNPKLLHATRQLESYFVGTLLKKMHESAAKGGLFAEKSESATYRDMFDDAVANEIGKRGSFGIADTLYKELITRVGPESGAAATPASAAQSTTAQSTAAQSTAAPVSAKP